MDPGIEFTNLILFVIYNKANKLECYITQGKAWRDKPSSLFSLFVSQEETEVLWIQLWDAILKYVLKKV